MTIHYTPNQQLPYPDLNDTANVPRDIQALATKLDGFSGLTYASPPVVTTLPASPIEGQECIYHPTVAPKNGATMTGDPYWCLRRISGVWRFMGGTPFVAAITSTFNPAASLGSTLVSLKTRCGLPAVGYYRVSTQVRLAFPTYGATTMVILWAGLANAAGSAVSFNEGASAPVSSLGGALTAVQWLNVASLASTPNVESWLTSPERELSPVNVGATSLAIEPVTLA